MSTRTDPRDDSRSGRSSRSTAARRRAGSARSARSSPSDAAGTTSSAPPDPARDGQGRGRLAGRVRRPEQPLGGRGRCDPAIAQLVQRGSDVRDPRRDGHQHDEPPVRGAHDRAGDRRAERPRVADRRRHARHEPACHADDGRIGVLEVPAGVRHHDGERPFDGDPQLPGPPREARAAGFVGVGEVEELVQQLPERGRGPGRDLPFGGGVPVGDRRGRRVARPEERVTEGAQPVRGELVAARHPAPQHPAGGQRPVEDGLHRAHGPCLGRRLVAQRAQRADTGHGAVRSDATSQSSATAAAWTSSGAGSAPRATSRAISSASASRASSSPARTMSGSRYGGAGRSCTVSAGYRAIGCQGAALSCRWSAATLSPRAAARITAPGPPGDS